MNEGLTSCPSHRYAHCASASSLPSSRSPRCSKSATAACTKFHPGSSKAPYRSSPTRLNRLIMNLEGTLGSPAIIIIITSQHSPSRRSPQSSGGKPPRGSRGSGGPLHWRSWRARFAVRRCGRRGVRRVLGRRCGSVGAVRVRGTFRVRIVLGVGIIRVLLR